MGPRHKTQVDTHSVHGYEGITSLYLIELAIEMADVGETSGLQHALASMQDIAGITDTAFRTGTGAGGGFPMTRLLARVCARLVVAVGVAVQGCKWTRELVFKNIHSLLSFAFIL